MVASKSPLVGFRMAFVSEPFKTYSWQLLIAGRQTRGWRGPSAQRAPHAKKSPYPAVPRAWRGRAALPMPRAVGKVGNRRGTRIMSRIIRSSLRRFSSLCGKPIPSNASTTVYASMGLVWCAIHRHFLSSFPIAWGLYGGQVCDLRPFS
jgi:hypothetical protein